jgi:saccharopine dehydrogenase-like NADP-dependent oxidoreductase
VRLTVLGAGRVGGAIVTDLARDGAFELYVADMSESRLARLDRLPGVTTVETDLADRAQVARVVRDADLVVGAVPGHMGLATLRAVVGAGKSVVDISFFPEDPFVLDAEARAHGVMVLPDCGVAPGCSNLILGHLAHSWEQVDRFACYVGGLPVERRLPWEYKAPFSPADVIEEYTRPARFVEHGVAVTAEALSGLEHVDFPGLGTLEAFNTDGLRTLLTTVQVPFMVEKTLRYPGHAERMRTLRDAGFFATAPVVLDGVRVIPRDLASRLLFVAWELDEGEEDLTVMRVVAEGVDRGRPVRTTFDLLDRYDRATGTTSMARTTGYTCTAVVRTVAQGLWREPGVTPPEFLGRDPACYAFVLADLAERGVIFNETVERRA